MHRDCPWVDFLSHGPGLFLNDWGSAVRIHAILDKYSGPPACEISPWYLESTVFNKRFGTDPPLPMPRDDLHTHSRDQSIFTPRDAPQLAERINNTGACFGVESARVHVGMSFFKAVNKCNHKNSKKSINANLEAFARWRWHPLN